ncbi:hypothetical protein D3C87_1657830 [compost metagenome]
MQVPDRLGGNAFNVEAVIACLSIQEIHFVRVKVELQGLFEPFGKDHKRNRNADIEIVMHQLGNINHKIIYRPIYIDQPVGDEVARMSYIIGHKKVIECTQFHFIVVRKCRRQARITTKG